MHMMQSVLLATDYRPASQAAEQVLVRLASVFGSTVTLLHVLEPLPSWPVALVEEREQASKPLREMVRWLTNQKVEVKESAIAIGSPAETIIRKAEEYNADLILIGAGDRSRFDRFTPGPVADAVLQHASLPVLAVYPGGRTLQFRKILCPVDHSSVSSRGLRNAIKLTRAFDAELVVLSVVPEVSWLTAHVSKRSLQEEAFDRYQRQWREDFDRFIANHSFDGVKWTREVRLGSPHQQILAAVEEHQADLIVMGSSGRAGVARVFMDSVTRRILQELPCSLLSVKNEDALADVDSEEISHLQLLNAEGKALLESGCSLPAIAKFNQILAHHPFHVPALEGLARAYEQLEQLTEADRCRHRLELIRQHGLG